MLPRALPAALGLWVCTSLALAVGPPPVTAPEVRRLIDQLGASDLATRRAAIKKLEALGEDVVPHLRRVGRDVSRDIDVRLRAHAVAGAIERALYAELKRFDGHRGWAYRVVVTPDGKHAVSSGDALRVWGLEDHKHVRSFAIGNWGWGLDVSHDSKRVLVTHGDRTARLYEIATGKEVQKFAGHTGELWMATLTPDGKQAITGAMDQTIRVWDVETGREKRRFGPLTDLPRCCAWSPDGKRLAVGHFSGHYLNGTGTLRIWDVESGKPVASGSGHTAAITAVSWSKDGKRIATSSFDKTLRVWDAKTAKELSRIVASDQACDSVAFTPDGKRLVSSGWEADLSIRLWDVGTGKAVARYDGHTASVLAVAVTPDGKRIVSSSRDGSVRLWRLGK